MLLEDVKKFVCQKLPLLHTEHFLIHFIDKPAFSAGVISGLTM